MSYQTLETDDCESQRKAVLSINVTNSGLSAVAEDTHFIRIDNRLMQVIKAPVGKKDKSLVQFPDKMKLPIVNEVGKNNVYPIS